MWVVNALLDSGQLGSINHSCCNHQTFHHLWTLQLNYQSGNTQTGFYYDGNASWKRSEKQFRCQTRTETDVSLWVDLPLTPEVKVLRKCGALVGRLCKCCLHIGLARRLNLLFAKLFAEPENLCEARGRAGGALRGRDVVILTWPISLCRPCVGSRIYRMRSPHGRLPSCPIITAA